MAAKKQDPPKKKPASAADFRRKEEADKAKAKTAPTTRPPTGSRAPQPKQSAGGLAQTLPKKPKQGEIQGPFYKGPGMGGATSYPTRQTPTKTPTPGLPKGTPWKETSPYNPNRPYPKTPETKPHKMPPTTTSTTVPQPRGMAQLGKIVPSTSESMAKKKKKK